MSAILTLTLMGLVLGFGLAFAADFFHVEADIRIEAVTAMLPGINCGLCGHPGCEAFATAIVEGEVESLSQCKPGKDKHYDPILAYLKETPDANGKFVTIKK
jgi:electron transport complex protein RnfB